MEEVAKLSIFKDVNMHTKFAIFLNVVLMDTIIPLCNVQMH